MSGRSTRNRLWFHGLVLEMTYRCDVECAHCYTNSGPRAGRDRLDVETARRVIEQAAADARVVDEELTLSGGEPMLYFRDCLEVVEHGVRHARRTAIATNARWARSPAIARARCRALAGVGLQSLEVSVDAYHASRVPSASVNHCIDAALAAGLDVRLRLGVTRESGKEEVLRALDRPDLRGVWVLPQAIVPLGRGRSLPSSTLHLDDPLPGGACEHVLVITVTPRGDVYPCCAGSALSPSLSLGNCKEEPLSTLLDRASANPFIVGLVTRGPAELLRRLPAEAAREMRGRRYANMCDLCTALFTHPRAAVWLLGKRKGDRR